MGEATMDNILEKLFAIILIEMIMFHQQISIDTAI